MRRLVSNLFLTVRLERIKLSIIISQDTTVFLIFRFLLNLQIWMLFPPFSFICVYWGTEMLQKLFEKMKGVCGKFFFQYFNSTLEKHMPMWQIWQGYLQKKGTIVEFSGFYNSLSNVLANNFFRRIIFCVILTDLITI